MSRVVCIIQARMGSTRLPGKVTLPILERPMLWWDMHRVQHSRLIDEIVIATTTESADDALYDLCIQHDWTVIRGSEQDVLDRYYQAATHAEADHIVRITSDCPLIDPHVIDYVVSAYLAHAPQIAYCSNTIKRSYPRGLDTEIFRMDALAEAWQNATESAHREHVTPFIWQQPERFPQYYVTNPQDYSSHRWTVDTPEDLDLVRKLYKHFGHGDFLWQEVLQVLAESPEWIAINQHIEQKKL